MKFVVHPLNDLVLRHPLNCEMGLGGLHGFGGDRLRPIPALRYCGGVETFCQNVSTGERIFTRLKNFGNFFRFQSFHWFFWLFVSLWEAR